MSYLYKTKGTCSTMIEVEMMNEARDLAIHRMIGEAEQMGADAVVNVRFATSAIIQGAAEVIAYGTAVKFIH